MTHTLPEWIARLFGKNEGPNTFFILPGQTNADISYPFNHNVKIAPHTSIAIGCVTWKLIPRIIYYGVTQKRSKFDLFALASAIVVIVLAIAKVI